MTIPEKIIKELNQINGELDALLYKIPLAGHHDIARLDYLINRQLQLLEIHVPANVPQRIVVLLDNAKDSALVLRERYMNALFKGKLRKISEDLNTDDTVS